MKSKRMLTILIILILIILCMGVFSSCVNNPETPKPWYRDYENVEIIIEDERSVAKSMTYNRDYSDSEDHRAKNTMTYIYDKENVGEGYLPNVSIFYKGEKQDVYIAIFGIDAFARYRDGVNYNKENNNYGNITYIGSYRVEYRVYPTKEDCSNRVNRLPLLGTLYIQVHHDNPIKWKESYDPEEDWVYEAEHIEYVVEDERSIEKSYNYEFAFKEYSRSGENAHKNKMTYTYSEDETEEYIPNITVFYKGQEKASYVAKTVMVYDEDPNNPEWNKHNAEEGYNHKVNDIGVYKVQLGLYKTADAAKAYDHSQLINIRDIFIVVKGD